MSKLSLAALTAAAVGKGRAARILVAAAALAAPPRPAAAITGGAPVAWSTYWMNYYNNVNRSVVGIGGQGLGSGILVAPRLVLTAGHCGRNGNLDPKAPGGPVGVGALWASQETIQASAEIDHYDVCLPDNCPDSVDLGLWVLDRPASAALPYWSIGSLVELQGASFFGAGSNDGVLKAADCLVSDLYAYGNSSRYSLLCGGQKSEGGDSGGPVFDLQLGLAGINRGGSGDPTRDAYGIVLTPDAVAWVNQSIAEYKTVLYTGDFDGDGRADLFHWSPNIHESYQDQANGTPADPTPWPDGKADGTLTWCGQQLRVGRFNAGVREDLLCYNGPGDRIYVNYAGAGGAFPPFAAVELPHTWCDGEVYVGDFNGDAYDDLFCRQPGAGRKIILNSQDEANPFPNASTWSESYGWCGQHVLIGRFDGDGDDVLCWNPGVAFYYRPGLTDGSLGASTVWASTWCQDGELMVGDMNDDGRDDLVCWNKEAHSIAIDFSSGVTRSNPQPFGTIEASHWYPFCEAAGWTPEVTGRLADVSGDHRADFVCHDARTGQVTIDVATDTADVLQGGADVKVPDVPTPIWP